MHNEPNPFRAPEDDSARHQKVSSDPSIECEPHIRPELKAQFVDERETVWNEPGLSREAGSYQEIENEAKESRLFWILFSLFGVVLIVLL